MSLRCGCVTRRVECPELHHLANNSRCLSLSPMGGCQYQLWVVRNDDDSILAMWVDGDSYLLVGGKFLKDWSLPFHHFLATRQFSYPLDSLCSDMTEWLETLQVPGGAILGITFFWEIISRRSWSQQGGFWTLWVSLILVLTLFIGPACLDLAYGAFGVWAYCLAKLSITTCILKN